ncbi:uncharacterized protein LOC114293132 [Camellia sinensis]|uniref:uncharacterized protein LOC114293132 n=1 Tax=Camellia sinensis TaxID=4442 RepID=UPI0010357946|nr:uncharacterized protein LOC114293132 [Camellia sinensis]
MEEDDHAPLWCYVTKLEKMGGGGNTRFKCNYCQQEYRGSYFRVKAHLLKLSGNGIRVCPKVTPQHLAEMQRKIEEAEKRLKMAMPKKIPLPPSTQSTSTSSGTLDIGGFRMEGAFQFAANNPIPGYVPPGYNLLRTTLLQKERANVERLLEPTRASWKEKGLSIVSDGWTDSQRRPLINFMGASEVGAVFLKAVNCEGEHKDKFFISNLISQAIEEVGHQNVIQVITDNAPVCSAAGLLIESKYPNIFWTPCVVHTMNPAL